MRRARRFHRRLVHWTSLCVVFALVLSFLVVTPFASIASLRSRAQNPGPREKVNKGNPVAGPPAAVLPNLDEVRRRTHESPRAQPNAPSTLRSRRKPIESREGRKVGDPLPRGRRASTNSVADSNERVSLARADRRGVNGPRPSHHAGRAHSANFLMTPAPQEGAQNVSWTNVVGVSTSGNSLTKTAVDQWGNGGAVSTQAIASGDGYVEFAASETSTHRMCGLSRGDTDQNYADIDFAIFLNASGSIVQVFEGGAYRGGFGSYAAGDHLRVAVNDGVVKYSRNGTVFYTSTVAPSFPLLADTSLYTNGGTITDAVISGNLSRAANPYMQNFIQVALARQPQPDEVNYWEDIFRAAYAHQQGSMMMAAREMARTIFESAEYADRQRNNHWYIYDLYETYLMRYPDNEGWGFWEGQCNTYGREQVRRAFDECGEFATNVAAIQPNGSASSGVYSLQSSRVNPENQPGNQLLARDAEWSVSLLSLPGRAGLDLGLGLSYSSAVWTKSGPYAYFDEDGGTPSPGFRLGFPTVEEVFFDAQAGVNVRLLVTSSGRRVELRQIGTTNVYEAADSSYLQLIDYGGGLTVRSTDGTQMSYVKLQDEWRCTQIKDRNGNLITVNYDWRGDIATIVDTLNRTITCNYDGNSNLVSITQNGRTQPWVTFGWGELMMQPVLSAVVGTHNGDTIPVLRMVSFADGTYDKFVYNASGQVTRVTQGASILQSGSGT